MPRSAPLLLVALLLAAGAAWYVLRGEQAAPPDVELGVGSVGRSAHTSGRGGPLSGPAPAVTPDHFEIAMEGARSLHDAIQARALLSIKASADGEWLDGGAVLDALADKVKVRFASAADAAAFRERKGRPPMEAVDGVMEVSIDMLPVLIDAMGFIHGEQDGELFLERPDHVVHRVGEGADEAIPAGPGLYEVPR